MTKKEKLRRKRISIALKRYHEQKEINLLDRLLEQNLQIKQKEKIRVVKNFWKVGKSRKKIKSFPKKDEPSKFFYATKREYLLKKPILADSDLGIKKIDIQSKKLRSTIAQDVIKNNKDVKPINLGYKIKMVFKSKTGGDDKVIETTSYRDAFIPKTKKDFYGGFDLLKEKMLEAFKEYITTSGFSELTFFGLETEIEE